MWNDIRHAWRGLAKAPGFTLAAGGMLALGIGASTAIFSVVDGVLLRPAPLVAIERLAMVWETDRATGTTREPASVPDYLDFVARSRTFDTLAAIAASESTVAPADGEPIRVPTVQASHQLLPMLGVPIIIGRPFDIDEDRPGGPQVAVISESFWERWFDRDPSVLGKTLRVNDVPHRIVGVTPSGADFGVLQILSAAAYSRGFADRGDRTEVDLWLPLQPDPVALPRETHPIFVVGRLASTATVEAARQELSDIAAELERAYDENDARGTNVESLSTVVFGRVRPALLVLLGAVALLLLIASANVATLLLARAVARAPEIAVRAALGASRVRLLRQFLVEGLLLAAVAAATGVVVAQFSLRTLLALAPADVPRLADVTIDLRVLIFTTTVVALVGLVFGTVSALQAWTTDSRGMLVGSSGQRLAGSVGQGRSRSTFVVAEVALALMLIVGAGLLVNSFVRLQRVDPGFRSGGVLKAEYQLPRSRYPVDFKVWPNFVEMHAFTGALVRRAAAVPGVEAVAVAAQHPMDPGFTNSFGIVGRESESASWPEMSVRQVTPGYFDTLGLRLAKGRLLRDGDATTAAPVILINEAASERFFATREPLGAQIRLFGAARTIVGVVGNERFRGLASAAPLAVYLPLAQAPSAGGAGVLLVRSSGDPRVLAPGIHRVIRDIDPGLAVFGVGTLDDAVAGSIGQERFTTLVIGVFASVALVLAALGIYSVVGYGVARRAREFGVRLALGADPKRLVGLAIREGLSLTLLGLTVGVFGALAIGRVLAGLLYGVTPRDPATLVLGAALLAFVALVASYVPARRVTRIDPTMALRME